MSENEYKVMKGNVWVKALLKEKRINGEWIVWKGSNALLHPPSLGIDSLLRV